MKNLSLEVDGEKIQGLAALASDGTLWIHLDGETFSIESEKRDGRRGGKSSAASANPSLLVAPMPGKIIKLMVNKDDQVQAQQVVLVMEAMKMEYTLKAQAAGKIAELTCAPGDQVSLGQLLVRLEIP